jgi:hypothetical protein
MTSSEVRNAFDNRLFIVVPRRDMGTSAIVTRIVELVT